MYAALRYTGAIRELGVLGSKDLNRSAFSVRNVVLRARASKARQAKGVVPYALCLMPYAARATNKGVMPYALCLMP